MLAGSWLLGALLAGPAVDGDFADWRDGPVLDERFGDAADPVDLGPLQWRLDDHGLWLRIRAAVPANIAQSERTLTLAIDNEGGGTTYRGSSEVDRVIEYSPPQGNDRLGFRTLLPSGDAWRSSETSDDYLRSAPTVASDSYEILLRSSDVVAGTRVQVMLWNDQAQDVTDWITLAAQPTVPVVRPALERHPEADLRVMVWNTGGERTARQLKRFARLIEAIDPDVALLDEVAPNQRSDHLKQLKHQSLGGSGGRQRGLILSRWSLTPVESFRFLDYPPTVAELVRAEGSDFMRRDLKNAASDGVPANGALVTHAGRRILLVALDLQCCGDGDDSVQDRLRVIQATRIAAAIDQAREDPGFDELIVGGDFNLVGSAQPLTILRGSGTTDLTIANALQPDGLSNVTWIRRGDLFPPGRLDYALHSPTLRQLAGVVFNPGVMNERQLSATGLAPDTTDRMSGHQPLVIDLAY
ncbi:MAG: endonuclease/exonuclease/phosphatase family protein [Pseudomonadota bacterium]